MFNITFYSHRPRRVSLVGNAIDAEELCKGLSAAASSSSGSLRKYEPGLESDDEEIDESLMTPEQIGIFSIFYL